MLFLLIILIKILKTKRQQITPQKGNLVGNGLMENLLKYI